MISRIPRIPIVLVSLLIISLLLCTAGIENRIPSENIKSLLFSDGDISSDVIPMIIDARRADKEFTDSLKKYKEMEIAGRYYMNLPDDYWQKIEEEKVLVLNNKKLFISKNKLKWMGNYLIASFYPDEQGIMHALSKFRLKPLDLNIHLFSYGGAYVYPLAAVLKLSSVFKLINLTPDKNYFMSNPDNTKKLFIIGKLFGILAYIFSILIIYLFCKIFFKSYSTAVLAATFFAINPALTVTSHFLKPWIYSVFWVLLCLYFSSKITLDNIGNHKRLYLFCGITAGMAMGSIYPAGYIFLALILCHYYVYKIKNLRLLFVAFIAFLLTHILTNPYHLIAFKEFSVHFRYTSETWFEKISYFDFSTHFANVVETTYAFGITFFASIICGMILALIKRKKEDIFLLICIFSYYIVNFKVISHRFNTALHLTPLLPLLVILGARFLSFLFETRKNRPLAILFIVIVALNSFTKSLFYAYKFKNPPTIKVGEWINKNIPYESTIGTWIDKDGYRPDYPPYNYLAYRFINDNDSGLSRIKNQLPDYYLAISVPYVKEPFFENYELLDNYQQLKAFKNDVPILSKFYQNKLLYFWAEELSIFKKRIKNN